MHSAPLMNYEQTRCDGYTYSHVSASDIRAAILDLFVQYRPEPNRIGGSVRHVWDVGGKNKTREREGGGETIRRTFS